MFNADTPTEGEVEASAEIKALNAAIDGDEAANKETDTQDGDEPAPKKEKTFEEKQIAKQQRRIDNLTKRYHLAEAELTHLRSSKSSDITQTEGDALTLSRAELQALIDQEAHKRATTMKSQDSVVEHRRNVVASVEKDLGSEKFNSLADDLDVAFGGLRLPDGAPIPAIEALLEADNPKTLMEYFADPDHADEAEKLVNLSPMQLVKAITKLSIKLGQDRPQASRAATPIEAIKGKGVAAKDVNRMTDKEFAKYRAEQIRNR